MSATDTQSIHVLAEEVAAFREENTRLRLRLDAVEHDATMRRSAAEAVEAAGVPNATLSRRSLMRRGGAATLAGLGAAVAAGLVTSVPAAASTNLALGSVNNTATSPTGLSVSDASSQTGEYGFGVADHGLNQFPESAGIAGHANSAYDNGILGYHEHGGVGVRGIAQPDRTTAGIGVSGTSDGDDGIGVQGTADGARGQGVTGSALTGTGVVGTSGNTVGVVIEFSGAGVGGYSKAGAGVIGIGRIGGVFVGGQAQIALAPGTRATHPVKGDRGELYVDKTGRLWYCRTSGAHAVWHQLA